MITSRIAEKHREHAMELGVNHYLGKPYSDEELLSLIQHYARIAATAEVCLEPAGLWPANIPVGAGLDHGSFPLEAVLMEPMATVPSPDPRLLACLAVVVRERASDLFIMAGAPPTLKRQGVFVAMGQQQLSADDVRQMAYSILRETQRQEFD
eukprot:gene18429-23545_t